jgi:hemerythrin-like domain-containing protein
MSIIDNRRKFLIATATLGVAAISPKDTLTMAAEPKSEHDVEAELSAPEDLMREHGVLNRILLVYEDAVRRLRRNEDIPPDVFHKPAELVRTFVEDYHEKLEERFVFPRFEEQKKLVELVTVLRQQHQAGRRLTDQLLRAATPADFGRAETKQTVVSTCEAFIRMYRPHEAREDTVLFPTLYEIVPAKEVKELGEQFEEQEHRLFGEGGFQETVGKVAEIEKQLGIYELASFTPK